MKRAAGCHSTNSDELRKSGLFLFLLLLIEERIDLFLQKQQPLLMVLAKVVSFNQILSYGQVFLYAPLVDG